MHAYNVDLIGDIHGHADPLHNLLKKLGYQKKPSGTWKHPEGRTIVFLGDYVDRGPKIRETLHTVRSMCDAGDAVALMGNHEHNAICMATLDATGKPLRPHTERNLKVARETDLQFTGKTDEWKSHLNWFKTLPLTLDLGELRAVHACWDPNAIATLAGKSLADPEILQMSRDPSTPEGKAILRLLNGPELNLPEGMTLTDKEGTHRNQTRVRWWNLKKGMTLGECIFPQPKPEITKPLEDRHLNRVQPYPETAPLVCFGHYWRDPKIHTAMIQHNLACLDMSIAKGGRLACLRNYGPNQKIIVTEGPTMGKQKGEEPCVPTP